MRGTSGAVPLILTALPDAVVRIDAQSGDVLGESEIEGISTDSLGRARSAPVAFLGYRPVSAL